jgi:hypothetical protein
MKVKSPIEIDESLHVSGLVTSYQKENQEFFSPLSKQKHVSFGSPQTLFDNDSDEAV